MLVIPITDWKPNYSNVQWFFALPATPTNGLSKDSGADAIQVKSVSLNRFGRKLGVLLPIQVEAVASAVALCVGAP